MSVKAMLIVAVMQAWTAEGGVAQYTSEYSSWEKCIEAKTLGSLIIILRPGVFKSHLSSLSSTI